MKSSFAGRTLPVLALASLAVACGPPSVRPASFPDPEVGCPAGLLSWSLDVQDQRAEPASSDKMIAAVRDGIQKSFPGCHWSGPGDETATITVAVHRFAAVFNDRYYDSAVDWTVTVRNASGRTITEFDANEQETRPAYSGADAESLNEAFRKALQRTVKGLAQVPRIGSMRPPAGTPSQMSVPSRRGGASDVSS